MTNKGNNVSINVSIREIFIEISKEKPILIPSTIPVRKNIETKIKNNIKLKSFFAFFMEHHHSLHMQCPSSSQNSARQYGRHANSPRSESLEHSCLHVPVGVIVPFVVNASVLILPF